MPARHRSPGHPPSVKVVAFGVEGALKGIGFAEYPILTPRLGYAEQDPEQWWRSTVTAVREALDKAGRPEILGIGFSGQMHGLVLLDQGKRLLRPAIIWADQRSAELLPEIEDRVGRSLLAQRCGTAPTAGFAIASLYWLQKFDPQTLERAATWMPAERISPFQVNGRTGHRRERCRLKRPLRRWATLRWLRSVLGREGASYEELVQLAAEVQPGSEGLFFPLT